MDLWSPKGTLASGASTLRPGHPQKYCSFGSITRIVEDWKCNGILVFRLFYVWFMSYFYATATGTSYAPDIARVSKISSTCIYS